MAVPFKRLGIPESFQKTVRREAPRTAKLAVAKGLLPTTADVQLALLYVLASDPDDRVAHMAQRTMVEMPTDQVLSGVSQNTHPKIIEFLAEFRTGGGELDARIIQIRNANDRTAVLIAQRSGSVLSESICRNQERLLLTPSVYVALHANPACKDVHLKMAEGFLRMQKQLPAVPTIRPFLGDVGGKERTVAQSPLVRNLEAEIQAALEGEQSPALQAAQAEPLEVEVSSNFAMFDVDAMDGAVESFKFDFDDAMATFSWDLTADPTETDDDDESDQRVSIDRRIGNMNVGDKIKLAYLGNKSARKILIRDTNNIVATAVVKSGRCSEQEVATYASNRNLSDEVVREICLNKEWTRKYPIKLALVNNPKTPLSIAMDIITVLSKKDLQRLAMNRNVSANVFTRATQLFRDKYR